MNASEMVLFKLLNLYLICLCAVYAGVVLYTICSQICKFMGWKYWGA